METNQEGGETESRPGRGEVSHRIVFVLSWLLYGTDFSVRHARPHGRKADDIQWETTQH
jgi:hypothetical protein